MNLTQKCQYALRAVLELSLRRGEGPVAASEVAAKQAIPMRFLELILRELRQAGFVESRRGASGGYITTVAPESLTVGEIIRFIDGPPDPVKCLCARDHATCPLHGKCAFMPLWERVRTAMDNIYDNTTFADLLDEHMAVSGKRVHDFCI